MAQAQMYKTPEQLVQQLSRLPKMRKYKITITSDETTSEQAASMITFGMFPQLHSLTEEDFMSAEWPLSAYSR